MALLRGVYRDGVVHLHEQVELPDNTEVDVSLTPVNPQGEPQSEHETIRAIFLAAGMRVPPAQAQYQSPLSPEREAEIARKLAEVGPIYDIIREERDSN